MAKRNSNVALFKPFARNSKVRQELRDHVDGPGLLGELHRHLLALDAIDEELADSVQESTRDIIGADGNVLRTESYTSTVLDKETIAVYHTRQAGRKTQIDTIMKLLNKVLPDLRAVENTDDIGSATERALRAFADAADDQ